MMPRAVAAGSWRALMLRVRRAAGIPLRGSLSASMVGLASVSVYNYQRFSVSQAGEEPAVRLCAATL